MLAEIIKSKKGKKIFALLIDPDKFSSENTKNLLENLQPTLPDAILVGGSLLFNDIHTTILEIKKLTIIPVFIFPGSSIQLSSRADGILFTSLISGRNADFLIGNQVSAAPFIKKYQLQTMSVGYMLVGENNQTAVKYMSNTFPIPYDKSEIAVATALAGEMLGLKAIYLEAGSGATLPVSEKMIQSVKKQISIPLIVGGGIRSAEQIEKIYKAGADVIVIGTAFEQGNRKFGEIKEMFEKFI